MGAGTRLLATFLVGGILGGCTLAEFSSINRDFNITNNPSKLIDAKQRTILVSNHLDPSGNTKPIVCAEPSPDALTVLAAGFAAQGQASSGDGGSLAASIAESGGSIGLRTQSIQLLRDGFYRLCESYLSGAIGAEEYDILQRRYQANMIGILAIEQLTGVVRPPAVVLGSSATADAGTNLAGLRQLRTDAAAKVEQNNESITVIKTDQTLKDEEKKKKIDPLEKQNVELKKDIESYDTAISKARSAVATATASGNFETMAIESSRFQGENVKHVAAAVQSIAENIINADYSSQLCFSLLRSGKNTLNPELLSDLSGGNAASASAFKDTKISNIIDFCRANLSSSLQDNNIRHRILDIQVTSVDSINKITQKIATEGQIDEKKLALLISLYKAAKLEFTAIGEGSSVTPPPSPTIKGEPLFQLE